MLGSYYVPSLETENREKFKKKKSLEFLQHAIFAIRNKNRNKNNNKYLLGTTGSTFCFGTSTDSSELEHDTSKVQCKQHNINNPHFYQNETLEFHNIIINH